MAGTRSSKPGTKSPFDEENAEILQGCEYLWLGGLTPLTPVAQPVDPTLQRETALASVQCAGQIPASWERWVPGLTTVKGLSKDTSFSVSAWLSCKHQSCEWLVGAVWGGDPTVKNRSSPNSSTAPPTLHHPLRINRRGKDPLREVKHNLKKTIRAMISVL